MPIFRLLNLSTLAVEEFDLDSHPKFLAASHAWIENAFGSQQQPVAFEDSFGGKGLKSVAIQIYTDVGYCWVDRLCIKQDDKQDKLNQIPLMERIFTQAKAVVVLINAELGTTQAEIDRLSTQLEGVVAMYDNKAYAQEGSIWQQGLGKQRITLAMKGLYRLASTVWVTRVWTMQEYVLAKKVHWIGLEYQPITLDDRLISAVPDVCNTLCIEEALTVEMQVIYHYLRGMASFRLDAIDRTRVMELLGNRQTKKAVDTIYGSMAASGVVIQPLAGESEWGAWRRWCEMAVNQGNIRWILLPVNGKPPNEEEEWSCIVPYFTDRDKISSSSCLDKVEPLTTVTIVDGCVTASARNVGTVEIIRRLGKVHEPDKGLIYRDITIIMFAQAKWRLALQLASAFGGGRYDAEQMEAVAQVLVQSYLTTVESVIHHTEDSFHPLIRDNFQQRVWSDFMQLQESQMLGLNEGTGYLCRVVSDRVDEEVITVLVAGDSLQLTGLRLELLDFEAKAPDGRSILMVVQRTSQEDTMRVLHKTAMTLPISEDVCSLWKDQKVETIRLGGVGCSICNEERERRRTQCHQQAVRAEASGLTDVISSSLMTEVLQQLSTVVRSRDRRGKRRLLKRPLLRCFNFTHRGVNMRRHRMRFLKRAGFGLS